MRIRDWLRLPLLVCGLKYCLISGSGQMLSSQTLCDGVARCFQSTDVTYRTGPAGVQAFFIGPRCRPQGSETGVNTQPLMKRESSRNAWAVRNKHWNFSMGLPSRIVLTVPFAQEKNSYGFFQIGNPVFFPMFNLGKRWLLNENAYIGIGISAVALFIWPEYSMDGGYQTLSWRAQIPFFKGSLYTQIHKDERPVIGMSAGTSWSFPELCLEGRYKRWSLQVQIPFFDGLFYTQDFCDLLYYRLSFLVREARAELLWGCALGNGGSMAFKAMQAFLKENALFPEAQTQLSGLSLAIRCALNICPKLHIRLSQRCSLELGLLRLSLNASSKPSIELFGKPKASFNAVPMSHCGSSLTLLNLGIKEVVTSQLEAMKPELIVSGAGTV